MAGEHHPLLAGAGNTGDDVSGAGPGPLGRAILDRLDAELSQLLEHRVGHGPLGAGRARDLAEPGEATEHALVVSHEADRLCASPPL